MRARAMMVSDAIRVAKDWILRTLGEEGISNLGLEEVEFNETSGNWEVTLGFSRPWNSARSSVAAFTGDPLPKRTYRVVYVADATGEVTAVRRREAMDA
jgi:hypothetical protein